MQRWRLALARQGGLTAARQAPTRSRGPTLSKLANRFLQSCQRLGAQTLNPLRIPQALGKWLRGPLRPW